MEISKIPYKNNTYDDLLHCMKALGSSGVTDSDEVPLIPSARNAAALPDTGCYLVI